MNPEPFFTTIPLEVLVASASIVILTIIFGFRWNPSITETTRDLATLRKYFHQAEPSGKFAIKKANRKTSKQNTKPFWLKWKVGCSSCLATSAARLTVFTFIKRFGRHERYLPRT